MPGRHEGFRRLDRFPPVSNEVPETHPTELGALTSAFFPLFVFPELNE